MTFLDRAIAQEFGTWIYRRCDSILLVVLVSISRHNCVLNVFAEEHFLKTYMGGEGISRHVLFAES